MAGAKVSPQDASNNWKTNFAGSGPKYAKGVTEFQGDPTKLAAAAADTWVANVTAAKPTFVASLQAVPAGYWAQRASTLGAQNLAAGAQKGADRQLTAITNVINAINQVVPSLPKKGNFQANMQRFQAYATAMHGKKGQLGG